MEQRNYRIKIDGVDLLSKTLNTLSTAENITFNHQLKTQAIGDEEKDMVVVFVQVKISNLNMPSKVAAEINIAMRFGIENFKDVFPKNETGKYFIPSEVENLLKSMSISTMRGIMFSEFRGTPLHQAILPIILMDSLQPVDGNLSDEIREEILEPTK